MYKNQISIFSKVTFLDDLIDKNEHKNIKIQKVKKIISN